MELSLFFLSFLVLVTLCASQDLSEEEPKCNLAFRCSYVESTVWTTTDNENCEVFRNECMLMSENCYRRNNNQPEARDIGQEECQKLCKKCCCCEDAKPICGYYNGERRDFGSKCEMDNVICATGKTYSLYSEGMCPKPVPV